MKLDFNIKRIGDSNKPYYSTKYGAAYLGDSINLLKKIPDNTIDLVLTSPPFALTRKKEYGNEIESEYINWFMPYAEQFYRILKTEGSLIIDLGGSYLPKYPVRSIYQFELLVNLCRKLNFYLAQEFYHYNPARLPSPAEWVNVRRIRVKDSVNVVWWLSKTPYPKSDNRKILKPYSNSMNGLLKNGYKAKMRPSGHDISKKFIKNNGGAIPPNLITIANTDSSSYYMKKCQSLNINPHPARFPIEFANFFIKFLTSDKDIIIDPFAGSNTTGYAANKLKRKWISIEIRKSYLETSKLRFNKNINPSLINSKRHENKKN
ncbi:MAG: site-specific DNA-methyltransferase [Ignavibacteriae bacterium]|nr:MAG: site-specific DNA-methyltransferase [Ignavibacteriota bacterium]